MAKNADLIILQIEVEIISLLDGLERIIVECQTQVEAGQSIQGYSEITPSVYIAVSPHQL